MYYMQIRWMDGIMNGVYTKRLPLYLFRCWVRDLAAKGCKLRIAYDDAHHVFEVKVWEAA